MNANNNYRAKKGKVCAWRKLGRSGSLRRRGLKKDASRMIRNDWKIQSNFIKTLGVS